MEKAKIDAVQLFVLIVLFELGSAMLIPLAIDADENAWLAILLGMAFGFFLFLIYHALYKYYPDMLPTQYMQKILGKYIGWALGFAYSIYFMYASARVLRDFGEMLLSVAYRETPLFIVNLLLMFLIMYTVYQGIEVLARTGEILFSLLYLFAITGFILIVASGLIDITHLKPVLEEGILPVLKVVVTETIYVPFGEMIVFTMIFPYLNNPKVARKIGISAIALSGINLTIVMAVNITVLGVDLTKRSQFPLLTTIQSIQIANFLERLDVFFVLALIMTIFIKITLYFYAGVIGMGNLFKVEKVNQLVYPLGLVVLLISVSIASSISEHIKEGLKVVPILLHLPFQIIIPLILLGIAFLKSKKKSKGSSASDA
ncbi:GerAB/ArcD/ProY family transporter [Pseudalkalibacillus caeni]|uniref:Spore gernimation protein KB n=1 Tax=Exobacillus caeni TaxID=2574798 RepID=A0A5R9F8D1_9BACL|nr:GerAB/ArcD/ProY family transporter [Pseudalkalibacillus caeni]TLS37103.1 spore gernimation protein KB [Pseudalkalibacillus caeni]